MDSKGMSMVLVVSLIILLASTIVIYSSVGNIMGIFKSSSDMEACRQSVELRANAKLMGFDLINSPLNCKQQKTIEIKDKRKWEDTTKEDLANRMHDCWYMYGEGKFDFLGDYDFNFGSEKKCYVCSSMIFEDSLKTEKISGFDNYLIENGEANFLFGKDYSENAIKQLYSSISTSRPLHIIFVAEKTDDFFNTLLTKESAGVFISGCYIGGRVGLLAGSCTGAGALVSGAAGCVGGGLVSSGSYSYIRKTGYVPYLYLTNLEDVNKICG